MTDNLTGPVQVLSKAFTILNIIGKSTEPISLTKIVHLSGMSKTTVHRLLKSLVAHQYVATNAHAEYLLGPQMMCLGARALNSSVATLGRDIAKKLYEDTDLTVCIAALTGFEAIYLLKFAPRITITQEIGSTRPAHCNALGKCLLAYLPEEELDAFIEKYGLVRLTPNTICDPKTLKEELEQVRRRGYSSNRQESNAQVDGIAAPIFDYSGKCIASISLAVIVPLTTRDIVEHVDQLMEAARAISRRLGYSPPRHEGN